jgi:hypothetical protein
MRLSSKSGCRASLRLERGIEKVESSRLVGVCGSWLESDGWWGMLAIPILTTVARKTPFRRTFATGSADKAEGIGYSCHSN